MSSLHYGLSTAETPPNLKAASASVLGLSFGVSAEVESAPAYVVSAEDTNGLEFRVYDPTGSTFLGSVAKRSVAKWSDELNGKGSGTLEINLTDPAVQANPKIIADDNIIKARFLGEDRFAWRVKNGSTTLISERETEDDKSELSGPGILSVLSEGILRPEYPISGDPTRESRERYFGYMSKHDSVELTSTVGWIEEVNELTSPLITQLTDWEIIQGSSVVTKSLGPASVGSYYESMEFTYSSSGSTEVECREASSDDISVNPGEVLSAGLLYSTLLGGSARVGLEFDSGGSVYGDWSVTEAESSSNLSLEGALAPEGSSSARLVIQLSSDEHADGNVVSLSSPIVSRTESALSFFSGNSDTTASYSREWTGSENDSTSIRYERMLVTSDRQASWYDEDDWTRDFEAIRKQDAKGGTGENSPPDWPDPTAYLVWPSKPTRPSNPGAVYWRNEFYATERMSVFVQAAADNRMRVWLDGAEIITAGFNGDATEITSSWDGVISEGTHLLAAETTNFQSPTPGDNYGWFLCTVMKKILNKPVGVVTHTDSSWYAYYKGDANVPYRDEVTTGTKTVTTEKKVSVKYKVRSGDTLSAIGRKYGVPWRKIYKANKKKIDDRAARSGLPNNGPGWWIFPGQILVIPGKYKTTSSTASVPSTSTKRVWSAGEALSTKRPGWYPHQILAKVFSEAKSRGVRSLASTELGFAFGFDSEGESWPTGHEEVVERSFRIASSVYEVAQELVEGGIDIRMGPDLVLRAYNQLGSYRGIGVAREDRFHLLDVGNSTLKYKIGRSTDLYNSLLIDTELGWRNFSTPNGDEIGLSEGGASLGGMNADRIAHAIGAELEELSRRTKTVSTTFRIVPGRLPYVDFDLGDIVVGHDEQGNVFDARITAIGIEEKSEYDIRCEVEASGEGLS